MIPRAQPSVEINVTPLIDVLLALVVILIVAAPLVVKRIPMPLQGGPSPKTSSKPLKLSVLSTGQLYLQGAAVSRAELAIELASNVRGAEPVVLEIRSDQATPYENVADAIAIANRSGVEAIRLADSSVP